jgi:hypothetical protein
MFFRDQQSGAAGTGCSGSADCEWAYSYAGSRDADARAGTDVQSRGSAHH